MTAQHRDPGHLTTKSNRPWYLNFKVLPALLFGLFLIAVAAIAVTSDPQFVWMRISGAAVLFFLLMLALFDNLIETFQKEQAWRKLAQRTNLTCQVHGSLLTGYSVHVFGIYRERLLTLSTFKQGKSQVPSTRIELKVNNVANASLRLRGPFKRQEADADVVVNELFQATDARQFGNELRYFIRSRPLHLVSALFQTERMRTKLQQLNPLVNIELEAHTLQFDSLGVLGDADYLYSLMELLSDIADVVERGSFTRLKRLPNPQPSS